VAGVRVGRLFAVGVGAAGLVLAVGAAIVWPRDDVPDDPAAIVVLGGAGPERIDLGIELHEQHGGVLVLSSSAMNFGLDRGLTCEDDDVLCIMPMPETTIGEAQTVARLADEQGWDHLTVVTSRFHTARARLLFRQCLGDDVSIVGAVRQDGTDRSLRTYVAETVKIVASATFERAC
jgi:uncharacterized SAM-binding protein YcdF (DUF218 family)